MEVSQIKNMNKSDDISSFQNNMRRLFELCNKILDAKRIDKKNLVRTALNRYIRVYEATEASDHIPFVTTLYTKNKSSILKGDNDLWLRDKNLYLQLGDGVEDKPDPKVRIGITVIYKTAVDMRDDYEKKLGDVMDILSASVPEYSYPDEFLLALYSLFHYVASEEERLTLSKIIIRIKKDMGEETEERGEKGEKENVNEGKQESNGGFGGMMGMMEGIIKGLGVKNIRLPSEQEMTSQITNVVSNPEIQKVFSGAISQLSGGSGDMGVMLTNLVDKLKDPTLIQGLQKGAEESLGVLRNSGIDPSAFIRPLPNNDGPLSGPNLSGLEGPVSSLNLGSAPIISQILNPSSEGKENETSSE